jgi:predicted  nucleic acid-binding Zn-ribbon protein
VNDETIRFGLQVLAILLGSGTVQLGITIYRGRAELRKVNTSADVDVATVEEKKTTGQDRLIDQLQKDGDNYRTQLRDLIERYERLQDRERANQLAFASQLRDAHGENARLTTRVAQLTTDVDILTRQNDDLRRRYLAGP